MTQNAELSTIDTKPIESKLLTLKERAEGIIVHDQASYALACQIVLDGRAEVKAIGFVLDPGIQSAKNHLDTLRNQKAGFVDRITPIVKVAEQKAEEWKAEERRKAKAEEDRINAERRAEAERIAREERLAADLKAEEDRKEREKWAEIERKEREKEVERQRKAGEINKREAEKQKKAAAEAAEREKKAAAEEAQRKQAEAEQQAKETMANVQTVKVAPSVPKVSGIKARVNYKFEVKNPSAVKPAFLKPDEVAIGQKVRDDKNPQKSEAEIGGIRVWTEDGI